MPQAEASDPAAQIENWYKALEIADAEALSAMLHTDAKIVLKNLDITQNRDAFLNSMSDWAQTIEGGALRYKLLNVSSTEAVVEVCYDFPENDILMQERFILNGDKIIEQEQEQRADTC